MKVSKAIQVYLSWKATYTQKAPITYKVHLQRFEAYMGQNKNIEFISLEQIVTFQHHLKSVLSPAGVAFSTIIIKNMFQFLLRQKIGVLDPWLIKIPKFEVHSHKTLEREDFEKMNDCLGVGEFYELEVKLIINMLWDTGMRVSELVSLNLSDLNLQARMAQVVTRKNRQLRWIMWGHETHELLLKYLGIRICLNQQPYLFMAHEGARRDRINVRTAQRWIKSACKRAGIVVKITAHSFRHAKAHRILNMGGGVVEVGKILGHSESNPMAAFSYLRLNVREFTEVAAKFL